MTRSRIIAALVLLSGCYASHERGPCEVDSECPPTEYCERRFHCLKVDGSVECDPFREGTGCAWFSDPGAPFGGRIGCEGELSSTLGWCSPPEALELWQ